MTLDRDQSRVVVASPSTRELAERAPGRGSSGGTREASARPGHLPVPATGHDRTPLPRFMCGAAHALRYRSSSRSMQLDDALLARDGEVGKPGRPAFRLGTFVDESGDPGSHTLTDLDDPIWPGSGFRGRCEGPSKSASPVAIRGRCPRATPPGHEERSGLKIERPDHAGD